VCPYFVAGTTEMWTERYKNTAFSTVTLHYVDEEWAIRQHVLFTYPFPKDEKKTGVNIRSELIRRFVQLGLSSAQFNEIVFVSDDVGANVLAALKPNKHFACCCHLLNTTLKHVFDEKFLNEHFSAALDTMQACKALVKYLCYKNKIVIEEFKRNKHVVYLTSSTTLAEPGTKRNRDPTNTVQSSICY
jgi:hypothetical protein